MRFGKYVPLFEEYYNENKNSSQEELNQAQVKPEAQGGESKNVQLYSQPQEQYEDAQKTGNGLTLEEIMSDYRSKKEQKTYDAENQISYEDLKKKYEDPNYSMCFVTTKYSEISEEDAISKNEKMADIFKGFGWETYHTIGGWNQDIESSIVVICDKKDEPRFALLCFDLAKNSSQQSILLKFNGTTQIIQTNTKGYESIFGMEFSRMIEYKEGEKISGGFTIVGDPENKICFRFE